MVLLSHWIKIPKSFETHQSTYNLDLALNEVMIAEPNTITNFLFDTWERLN